MRRTHRLIAQLALLPVLWLLAMADIAVFRIVAEVAVLVAWPISVAVAILLVWLARMAPDIDSLTETADNAISLAIVSTSLAGVAVAGIARIFGFVVDGTIIFVLLAYAIILVSAPSLAWLRTTRDVWLPMIRRR